MKRGGGCAIRPAPTQKWAAATYLAIGTTKKKLRRDTTTKNRSHKPQIRTTISPGCVVLCTPGDKSMVCQKRPNLSPGCRILSQGVISYGRVISCVSYGIQVMIDELRKKNMKKKIIKNQIKPLVLTYQVLVRVSSTKKKTIWEKSGFFIGLDTLHNQTNIK